MIAKPYYIWQKNDLLLEVKVQTKASKDGIVGLHGDHLKITITAAPVDGKANQHLIKFLAKYFGVMQRQVEIKRGAESKYKSILISDPKKNVEKLLLQFSARCVEI